MEPMTLQLLEGIAKDKDACNLMASMFQNITSDMKSSQPVWEDFAKQANKLHACLRSTLVVVASYLDAFQRVADTATTAKGATKEIGTALTRICLRHRAVEAKVKAFASALMDCLIVPLQEKLDDWRKVAAQLEKDHAKEYRRHRTEVKKRSVDALKQQRKKMGKTKSAEAQRALDLQMTDVQDRYQRLETSERGSLAAALIEERSRYCRFVTWLKPVVQSEVCMAEEMFRLSEVMEQLESHTTDPFSLSPASEQMMLDMKGAGDAWRPGPSPPESPAGDAASSSLGSRKSSLCSINSLHSASSGGTQPGGALPARPRSLSQTATAALPPSGPGHRVASVSSHDSGFTSQDTLFVRPATPPPGEEVAPAGPEVDWCAQSLCGLPVGEGATEAEADDGEVELRQKPGGAPPPPEGPAPPRPHTISNAYSRGSVLQRPSLGTLTFVSPSRVPPPPPPPPQCPPPAGRPPVPDKGRFKSRKKVLGHYACPNVTLPDFNQAAPHMVVPQPVYANTTELRQMAALKEETAHEEAAEGALPSFDRCESDGSGSNSSGYGSVQAAAHAQSADALPPPPDFVLYNFCEEPLDSTEARRPMSIAVPSEVPARYAGLRRSQSQLARPPPPPPVRRDSTNSLATAAPPVGIDGATSVQEAVRALTERQHQTASPATLRREVSCPAGTAATVAPPAEGVTSVQEAVRALTERQHQPVSPVALRRAPASRDPCFLQSLTARLAAGASPPTQPADARLSLPTPRRVESAPQPLQGEPRPELRH